MYLWFYKTISYAIRKSWSSKKNARKEDNKEVYQEV